jgi:ATP-dependent Clp protease ATP-binding subunit ClpC
MFERFTEKARRSVFFARHEAASFGSPVIEVEHLLLGVLREDKDLALRLLGSEGKIERLRERIAKEQPAREKISVSVDLPFSQEARRVIVYAGEESERLGQNHIATAHLLWGLRREEQTLAALVLREFGVTDKRVRDEARVSSPTPVVDARDPEREPPPIEGAQVLTRAAREGCLDPLIGREREVDLALAILSRRRRHNPAILGGAGVGKTALVEGIAQRIADGAAPIGLVGRSLASIHAGLLASKRGRLDRIDFALDNSILCIEALFDSPEAHYLVLSLLLRGATVIATGTPEGFRRTAAETPALAQYFEAIELAPPSDAETTAILIGVKERYEKFHHVSIGGDAIQAALRGARRFPTRREVPDRALDLLDEAAARARIRGAEAAGWADVEAVLAARTGAAPRVVAATLVDVLERNRRHAMAFYDLLFNQAKPADALARYAADVYIEHNPAVPEGKEAFIEYFTRLAAGHPGRQAEVKHAIAEGDYVALHSHQQWPGERGRAAMDIFRLDGAGKIVEHWDVGQTIAEESANRNTMF